MLKAGSRQHDVAIALGITQSVIIRLWARYRITGNVAELLGARSHITKRRQDRYIRMTTRQTLRMTAMV